MQWSRDVERPWVTYAHDTSGDERYRFFRYDVAADLGIPNEGHGLTRPMSQFYFGVAMIEFLTRCLATDAG